MGKGKEAVAVSAPGKVLLAGGYLVLDRAYTGLVFGLDARIHVVVQDIPTRHGVILNQIVVRSPQFKDAVWEYGYRLSDREGGMTVTQLRADADLNLDRNPFIETALTYALTYIASVSSPMISPASVTILADNDYYSTPSEVKTGAARRFHNFGVPITKAHKTGLGSSAALVTSFTAALLSYYLPKDHFDLESESGKRQLHNLAQAAHCAAQGKVGSGFDVASAVYGSCVYRRFSPCILSSHVEPGKPKFASQLRDLVEETGDTCRWDTEVHKDAVKVPLGLRLVMCDVNVGSQTPGMVKKVLAWRKEQPQEANPIWNDLDQANERFAAELRAVAENGKHATYDRLKERIADIRQGIRHMSEASGVPIEPSSQTKLIDACESLPGVIGGVVPGAGGYDAISLLIEDREEVIDSLQKLLTGWQFKGENETEGQGRVSMLGVREEMAGVGKESPTRYKDCYG
ncbi:putative phosphomevalonate kinase [Teratosphaeria destructans]|uniref:Phosphomevalonate kinase n=1 Tax=Teratosphaeria destructans TaxID=418781 RepID=A0A9W7W6C2_9PEZI|nr:putative phosphomevalonate kinase [Teratosphaeria destructans]